MVNKVTSVGLMGVDRPPGSTPATHLYLIVKFESVKTFTTGQLVRYQ